MSGKFTIGFWNVGSVNTQPSEGNRPKEIEQVIEKEKCDILVLTAARRPMHGFNENVLARGFGWGELHERPCYWIGISQTNEIEIDGVPFVGRSRAINGVMIVFSEVVREYVIGDPKSFSDHEPGVDKDIAKATSKMAEMVFNTSSQATTENHPNNQGAPQGNEENQGELLETETVAFEKTWMAYLRKQYYEDLETRMLHSSLTTLTGVKAHIFGCYVKTNNNTKESEQCAIIFFLKLNRIIKKLSDECTNPEFVIICGHINAEIGAGEIDSDDNQPDSDSIRTTKVVLQKRFLLGFRI